SHVDPDWGPAGQWLVFVNHREEGGVRYSRIEKVRLDGTQRIMLSSGGKFLRSSSAKGQGPLGDLDPDYSPDGAMVCSVRRLVGGDIRLFTFGANAYYGGKGETEMSWPHDPDVVERTPQFSPDGRRIVLTRSSLKAGHRTRQIVLTDPQSSFRRYLTSWEKWDAWHPSWYPFAHSGADRDAASTVVHYRANDLVGSRPISAQENDGNGSVQGLQSPDGVRFVASRIRTLVPKADQTAAYEIRWKLDIPPEKMISLTLRFQGRLSGVGSEGKSLRFRLMDWQEKRWVTIFVRRDPSNDKIKILHEFTPANFIKRDTRQVMLRIVALGSPATSAPTLETDHLSLDVRRE
ncbi:MAG: TolB family protein, partial [Candidatus Binatia bacterium]